MYLDMTLVGTLNGSMKSALGAANHEDDVTPGYCVMHQKHEKTFESASI